MPILAHQSLKYTQLKTIKDNQHHHQQSPISPKETNKFGPPIQPKVGYNNQRSVGSSFATTFNGKKYFEKVIRPANRE